MAVTTAVEATRPSRQALHVRGVEPHVGHPRAGHVAAHELGDVGVEVGRNGADLVLGEPGHAHPLGDPLHLARARAGRVHLGHGRRQGPVDPLVAGDDVLGEEAARAQLGHPQGQLAHAGLERAGPVAVPAVAGRLAHLVGLGVHDAVGDVLGEPADELLQVYRPVLEPGHRARPRRDFCYILHAAFVPFLEPDLSRFQILGRRPPRIQGRSEQALTPTFPTRSVPRAASADAGTCALPTTGAGRGPAWQPRGDRSPTRTGSR